MIKVKLGCDELALEGLGFGHGSRHGVEFDSLMDIKYHKRTEYHKNSIKNYRTAYWYHKALPLSPLLYSRLSV